MNKSLYNILKKVFTRGYEHGIRKGKSNDRENYAVLDAIKELKEAGYGTAEDFEVDRDKIKAWICSDNAEHGTWGADEIADAIHQSKDIIKRRNR